MINTDKMKDEILGIVSNWPRDNKQEGFDALNKILFDAITPDLKNGDYWLVKISSGYVKQSCGDLSIISKDPKLVRMKIESIGENTVCVYDTIKGDHFYYKFSDIEFVEKL